MLFADQFQRWQRPGRQSRPDQYDARRSGNSDHQDSDDVTYRQLFQTPGLSVILGTMALLQFSSVLTSLTLILYTLERWGSAQLVGLLIMAQWIPGILVSPFAGILLDNHRKKPLVILDSSAAAAASFAIVVTTWVGVMTPWLLLTIVAASSLTAPFADFGLRTLLATVPKSALWDAANAAEHALSSVMGTIAPALAGLLIGAGAGVGGLMISGSVTFAAGINLVRLREPATQIPNNESRSGRFVTLANLKNVLSRPKVRGVAVTVFIDNMAIGVLEVALPFLLLDRFGVTGLIAGLVWSFFNLASFGVTLRIGVRGTNGREGSIITISLMTQAVGFLLLLAAGAPWLVLVFMAFAGASLGPIDVSTYSLLQRSVDPSQMGRANSLALMIASLGIPLGAMLGGVAAGAASPVFAVLLSPALAAVAATASLLMLGRDRNVAGANSSPG